MWRSCVSVGRAALVGPHRRWLFQSRAVLAAKVYTFEDVRRLVQQPAPGRLLVDVREPEEVQENALPGAVNIPLKSSPGALGLSAEEFRDVFHFDKPPLDSELVFLCARGVRAQTAEELARSYGYEHTGVYPGSIAEWIKRGGETVKKQTKA
ncbi:thiosulfate sulfurtransferase RDL2 KNAG_0G02970 [Huiozyma naganishii CBS 8797]|uniref:Rhodanese domain-containing protein n=1 Tax=Huiozyma naganishii (strain ATCC MYA-139 / BCRC 22969 / CBS 8797 / KCTC 17520 / NBRC 10181 / NCYC 3082 / Yp74L-3) TaxID=1071383 RepID=J7S852_HUIN7|nr:hypothetical protein KNAG_0G02970 [Kazachstania naganishii CBS 8797]CCK71354.1 hypothetical protein KNAG_0G02970 [Kazachstania naganishii CBS 8797]